MNRLATLLLLALSHSGGPGTARSVRALSGRSANPERRVRPDRIRRTGRGTAAGQRRDVPTPAGPVPLDYRQPYAQQIVADGERLWLYDQDLAQVSVRPLGQALRGGPLAALSGTAPLADNFTVSYQGIDDNLRWYRLRPRGTDNDDASNDPSQFSELRLGFDLVAEQPLLRRLTLLDGFGRRTELRLAGLQRNPTLDDALFEFSPPDGVDVVGE